MKDNRRNFLKKSTALAALSVAGLSSCSSSGNEKAENAIAVRTGGANTAKNAEWPIKIGENMPRLTVGVSSDALVAEMRQIKQIGVDYVLMGGPPIPWTVESLREIMDRFKAEGLTVINMMIGEHPNTIYGREGRDEEIKKYRIR
ncbi:twin-arginine translocation signal domain-containing protein [Adhaeribacter arboris]|uniref:twin-arginine translocation signal domain-containing protein n=1 Tax=Adhaeribacter arboris TaxID=2072846 RepID=UPI0018ED9AF8|nr:twin-arginine translocation signal domain-containing protein [Adhaeribacter arboris]